MEYEFQGLWIPASVLLDEALTPFQKLLIAEIDGLSGPRNGPCHASSAHLAKIMNSTDGSIRTELTNLTKRGYLIALGGDGITTWRCVAPKYSSNLGKYTSWLEDKKLPEGVNQRLQGCQPLLTGLSLPIDTPLSMAINTENRSNTEQKKSSSPLTPPHLERLMNKSAFEEISKNPVYAALDLKAESWKYKEWSKAKQRPETITGFLSWLNIALQKHETQTHNNSRSK